MQQLSDMDSTFVQQESVRTPMHISPVLVYDQSARKDGVVRFKEILAVFERNLHKSTIFRRKLAGGAMGLFHAVMSAGGRITINFLSCREMLPDPQLYQQCLQESFDELLIAAEKADTAAVKSKPKSKSKSKPGSRRRPAR